MICFFFQAEDGIRDTSVTGVQTCALPIFANYNFAIDGSDNFPTKFLVNDIAVKLGIAFSHAGIVRLQGQTMTVIPKKSRSEERRVGKSVDLGGRRKNKKKKKKI